MQAQRFWKEFNKNFKKKTEQKIEPLLDDTGNLLTETKDIENQLFSTFFEGNHLETAEFDDFFFEETNKLYHTIICEEEINEQNNEHWDRWSDLNAEISTTEINDAIKSYKSSGKSSDKENFNPVMFKNLGPKAISNLKKLANLCLSKAKWIWDKAEVIFLKKAGKSTYAKPGSYRPISISSYIGKLIEKIIAERIKKYLIAKRLYDPDQEGFMEGRNTRVTANHKKP